MVKIYLLSNITNKKIYVGKTKRTLDQRWASHVQLAKSGKDLYISRAILKYGQNSFRVDLLTEVEDDKANYVERLWIASLRSYDSEIGYNGTFGGDGGEQTEEVKQKIGLQSKRLWSIPEYRKKVSDSLKGLLIGEKNPMFGKHEDHPWFGRSHTTEAKQKISESRKELFKNKNFKQRMIESSVGKHHTEEGKANIAKALKGNQFRKGISHSPEIKAQISASMKKAWIERRKKEVLNEQTKPA